MKKKEEKKERGGDRGQIRMTTWEARGPERRECFREEGAWLRLDLVGLG